MLAFFRRFFVIFILISMLLSLAFILASCSAIPRNFLSLIAISLEKALLSTCFSSLKISQTSDSTLSII